MHKKPIKVAVVSYSISHFEVPLYRLISNCSEFQLKVFYIKPVSRDWHYDSEFQQNICWGEDILSGYKSQQGKNIKDLTKIMYKWNPDVALITGFSWPGALKLILMNRVRRIPQIHRGSLNYYKDPRRGIKAHIARPLRKYVLRIFDSHHYGGSYSKSVLEMAGIRKEAMFFIPYSVDSQFFVKKTRDDKVHARTSI